MDGPVRVSAVVPTHNHGWCVQHAIDSLLRQSHPVQSIAVVDDGSTDDTVQNLVLAYGLKEVRNKQYAGLVNGIEIILQSNAPAVGPGMARNIGAALSKGYSPHLFAFLDSDDEYHPDKVKLSVEAYLTAPQAIGVIYSDYTTLNDQGQYTREYKEPYSQARLFQECIVNCDSLVSAEAFEWAGGFPNIRTCEDYSLWLKLSKRYVGYHIPESLVTIRVGGHSSTATVPRETWQACYRKAFELAGLINQ